MLRSEALRTTGAASFDLQMFYLYGCFIFSVTAGTAKHPFGTGLSKLEGWTETPELFI